MINLSVEAWPYVPAIQRRTYPATPELDKMVGASKESQVIGEFLDWLQGERGVYLAVEDTESPSLFFCNIPTNQLLAEFYGIDLKAAEQERLAVLDWLRG